MNKSVMTISNLCLLLFAVLILGSCGNTFDPGNRDYANSSMGLVSIFLGGEASSSANALPLAVSAFPRTLAPATNDGRYVFKFTNHLTGKTEIETRPIGTAYIDIALNPGTWTLEVERWETGVPTDYLVARGNGNKSIVLIACGTDSVTVDMKPIEGDTGIFSYSIITPSSMTGIRADLRVVRVLNGTQYGFTGETLPAGGVSGKTLNLPAGDYDVYVSLTAADNRGTGKYSAARIYSGLVTSTSQGGQEFFKFTEDHFVKCVNLAGTLSIENPEDITFNDVTITAHNPDNGDTVGDPWSWVSGYEWKILNIPPQYRSVYFTVEVTASDGNVYKTEKALILSNIPDKGKDGISISTGIYPISIDNSSWPSGSTITPKVLEDTRTAASPGEKVDLIVNSTHGLKQGSLEYNSAPVSASGVDYYFTMPAEPVTLSASFFSANLGDLSITTPLGIMYPTYNTGTETYNITVPNSVSAITVNATPEDDDVTVTVTGPAANLSVGENTITVRVKPLEVIGGTGHKDYTLNVTRKASGENTLARLTVDSGTLVPPFTPLVDEYTVYVDVDVISITIEAVAADSNASVSGAETKSLLTGKNECIVTVTSQSDEAKDYTINVIRKSPNTLSGLLLSVTLDQTFSSDRLFYTAKVPYSVTSVTVAPQPEDVLLPPANMVVTEPSGDLDVGINTITVKVTPRYGTAADIKIYTIDVTRDCDRNLDSLSVYELIPGDLDLYFTFDPEIVLYNITVPSLVSSITVEAAAPDGGHVTGTELETQHILVAGAVNTFYVIAVAQDGLQKVYTIKVTISP